MRVYCIGAMMIKTKRCSQSCMGDNPDNSENKESPSGAGSQWRGDEAWHLQACQWTFTPNYQTIDGDDVPQTGFQSDSSQEARGRPRDRFPMDSSSPSDKDIAAICNMIYRSSGLASGKTPDRGN